MENQLAYAITQTKYNSSDDKAAKKLRKMIENAIDDNDIDGYDLIVSMNNDTINLVIDCDEIR